MPETLEPMVLSIFKEMTPLLDGGAQVLRDARESYPSGKRLPRHMGQTTCPLGNGQWTQKVFPYTFWMAQRILDCYKQLPPGEALQVNDWLKRIGGEGFLRLEIPRLQRMGLRAAFV
jgi:hypothetical protein